MDEVPGRASAAPRRKLLKPALYALAAVALITGASIAYFVATFDPRDYHDRIVSLVREHTGRTLDIKGDIGLSFWPDLAVRLGPMSLSERDSAERFAHVEAARVRLELRPLFSRELKASEIVVSGADVRIVRSEDGRLNIDDLLKGKGDAPRFEIGRVSVERSVLTFSDLATGARYELSDVALSTGRIAPGIATPVTLSLSARDGSETFAVKLGLKGRVTLDLAQKQYALENAIVAMTGSVGAFRDLTARASGSLVTRTQLSEIVASAVSVAVKGHYAQEALALTLESTKLVLVPGKAAGETVSATVGASGPAGTTDLKLSAASVARDGDRVSSDSVGVDLIVVRGPRIEGSVSGPIDIDLAKRQVLLRAIAADVTATDPRLRTTGVRAVLTGNAKLDVGEEGLALQLAGKIAESGVKARITLAGLASPVYGFAVEVDELDLDRHAAAGRAARKGSATDAPASAQQLLDPLRNVAATGTITIGLLKTSAVRARDVKLVLK